MVKILPDQGEWRVEMDFGVGFFPTFDGMAPSGVAQMVEDHGFSALYLADHTHVAVGQGFKGLDRVPHRYLAMHELFVAMMSAAQATTRLRIASAICLVVQRDPIITAKTVASIDYLSGGRVELGVGAGWARKELENHGVDFASRMSLMKERVQAMKLIWTSSEASYHGDFVNFDGVMVEPKPAQRPHPPVLLGGAGPGVIDRVLDYADGWIPNYSRPTDPDALVTDDLTARVRELHSRADRPMEVQVVGVPPEPAVLEQLQATGVRRASHWLPVGGRSVLEPALEKWSRAINDFNGT